MSSIKSMIGHTMGAASAIEAAVCALAVAEDRIPPTMNLEEPEEELDFVPNEAREHRVRDGHEQRLRLRRQQRFRDSAEARGLKHAASSSRERGSFRPSRIRPPGCTPPCARGGAA